MLKPIPIAKTVIRDNKAFYQQFGGELISMKDCRCGVNYSVECPVDQHKFNAKVAAFANIGKVTA